MLSLSPTTRAWGLLGTIGLLVFCLNIDYTAVNLVLVPISREIESDLSTLQWLLSAYVLVWAALVIPAGKLADLKGKLVALHGGIMVFILGSAVAAWGQDVWVLIAGRVLQGAGAAYLSAPAYGLIFSSTPPEKQGFAMGCIGTFAGLGLAVGPMLAGWIIETIGWRWIFYLNIPLGMGVMVALKVFAEKDYPEKNLPRLNYVSSLVLVLGMGIFFLTLNQVEVWGITHPYLWGMGGISLTLLGGFWFYDQRQNNALLSKDLLKNVPFAVTLWAVFVGAYVFSMSLVLVTLYLQNTLKLGASETGYTFLAFTLIFGILSPLGGKLGDKMNIKNLIVMGILCQIGSLCLMMFWQEDTSLFSIMIPLFLLGASFGLSFPAINTAMFRTVPPAQVNAGSALFTMAMMMGNTFSVIANTGLLVFLADPYLSRRIKEDGLSFTLEQKQHLLSLMNKVNHDPSQFILFPGELKSIAMDLVEKSFLFSFRMTLGIAVLLSLMVIYVMRKKEKNQP